jgi:hypothetical protein
MRRLVRAALMIASLGGAAFVFWQIMTMGRWKPLNEVLLAGGVAFGFLLNFAYLWTDGHFPASRLTKLLNLWLDAKEAELRRRSKDNE